MCDNYKEPCTILSCVSEIQMHRKDKINRGGP